MEVQGKSSETDVKMCGDEMSSFDDCGKIDAVRFFVVSALFLCVASAASLLLSFAPVLKPTESLRRKLSLSGISLSAVVLLWNFLAVCIASSVDMADNYNLSGAGFIFLVLELFFVTLAIAFAVYALKGLSSSTTVVEIGVAGAKSTPSDLPTVMGQQSPGGQDGKMHREDASGSKDDKSG